MRSVIAADTCIAFIKRCTTSKALDYVHAAMFKSGLSSNIFFSTNLVAHYASLGSIYKAYSLFTSAASSASDIFLVNVMLRAFVDAGEFHRTLLLYRDMRRLGDNTPDHFTFPFVLKAAGYVAELDFGCGVHCDVIRFGYVVDVVVCNAVIGMYGKCGRSDLARHVFDEMLESKSSVTWSSMIGAYAENGCFREGLLLFRSIASENEEIGISRSILLNVMACVSDETDAHSIFSLALAKGYESDQLVLNTAMRMFSRIGRIDLSRSIFRQIVDKDVVTWSSMIEAYVLADSPNEAFKHFIEMRLNGLRPDYVTLISLVRACCIIKSLQQARLVHGITLRLLSTIQVSLGTALVDLYIKCGSIKHARITFDQMHDRNSVTWSTMIAGYRTHGLGNEALHLYNQMRTKANPDHITFVSILSACSHSGLISEAWECFKSMERDFGITPRLEHYACMVDLLGRAGQLVEARRFIDRMPIAPGVCVWGSLLSACRIHSNFELAEEAAKCLIELDGCNSGRYVVLSNVYSSAGKQEEAEKVRKLLKQRNLTKCVGQAFIHRE